MLALPPNESSYWRDSYSGPLYPKLTGDLSVDVAIVGAGITGLTTAYLLKQAGLKVVVLDKDAVGGGTTGRTTGKVTSQHELVYADLYERLGQETARLYGEANQSALDLIGKIVRQHRLSCDWKRAAHFTFTIDAEQVKTFQDEARLAAKVGLPASFVTDTPLPFEVAAAVRFDDQASMNAQQYVLGLARLIAGNASHVFEYSPVNRIHDGAPGFVSSHGHRVTAQHIVVATNVPTLPLIARGAFCLYEYPRESFIVAARIPKEQAGMFISPDDDNYSILPVGKHRILIGGESNISGMRLSKQQKYRRLADYAVEHFGATEITHAWGDRDYIGYDGLPVAGKLYPWSKNTYVASAFRKWGLTNGTAAAMIISDAILDKPNPWAAIYEPNRFSRVASIPRVVWQYARGKS